MENHNKTGSNSDSLNHPMGGGEKGSQGAVQVTDGGIEAMLGQLHQILAQLTQKTGDDNSDTASNAQLAALATQLAGDLQAQGDGVGEPAMQTVLQIIDKLADMLDNGQLSVAK